jgi:hypothetical protein
MLDYYENILCIEGGWLYGDGDVMKKSTYDSLVARGKLTILRNGGGKDRPALISYDSLPSQYRKIVDLKVGNVQKVAKVGQFMQAIIPDNDAAKYYYNFKLPDGRNLPESRIREYVTNATLLNAISRILSKRMSRLKANGKGLTRAWEDIASVIEQLKDEYPHTLPSNYRRLRDRHETYIRDGYIGLVHKGYCNDNSRKVSADMERLILSLYCLPNKPFASSVHDMYLQFLGGTLEVVDYDSGEIFDRNDFFDDKGVPVFISESTIWNYINNPKNRVIVDRGRSTGYEFNNMHRPHHHRHLPNFSLSKISMDDRDIPRKLPDGSRVKAYYAYDVASGCLIGASYSKFKDKALFIDCMRDMFRFIKGHGLGMPLEVEVEHHIVNKFKDDLMKAGIVFPFVRWCNPGNSQEKHAEHGNKAKKYGFEKKYQDGIGRFYSRLEANRPKVEKTWDDDGMKFKEKVFTFEELVADDLFTIEKFNNSKHPNQKFFPGMTRMDVLLKHSNPEAADIDDAILFRYIGEKTETSIRRSQYVTVQYAKYVLPKPEVLGKLKTNTYNVEAYYLPDDEGNINTVYLYQGDEFICACNKIETYNTATAEQTEADHDAYVAQAKYVSQFDKMTKDGKASLSRVMVRELNDDDDSDVIVETVTPPKAETVEINSNDFDDDDELYTYGAIDSL